MTQGRRSWAISMVVRRHAGPVRAAAALQHGRTSAGPCPRVHTPSDLARFLALLNVAMADAGVSAWEAKYYYKFWRPMGIRWPNEPGGNPTWYPLGAQATTTRLNFTAPSGLSLGPRHVWGAVFEILRSMPDATPFTFVSDEFNGLNRDVYGYLRPRTPATFTSLTDAETSCASSRIWIGVHWQADEDQGVLQGRRVAQHVLSTFGLRRWRAMAAGQRLATDLVLQDSAGAGRCRRRRRWCRRCRCARRRSGGDSGGRRPWGRCRRGLRRRTAGRRPRRRSSNG